MMKRVRALEAKMQNHSHIHHKHVHTHSINPRVQLDFTSHYVNSHDFIHTSHSHTTNTSSSSYSFQSPHKNKHNYQYKPSQNKRSNSELDSSSHSYYLEKPQMITHHIFWLSLFDIIFSTCAIILWCQSVFNNEFLTTDKLRCIITDFISTFAMAGVILWYFMVAWWLFTIIFNICPSFYSASNGGITKITRMGSTASSIRSGVGSPKLSSYNDNYNGNFNHVARCHTIIVLILVCAIAVVPLVFNQYGRNAIGQCDFKNDFWQLIIYGPTVFVILFSLFLMIVVWIRYCFNCLCDYCCCCCCCSNRSSKISIANDYGYLKLQNEYIAKRLTMFTFGFLLVWSCSVVVKVTIALTDITEDDLPDWLNILRHFTLALNGCVNAYIWSKSQYFESFKESYVRLNDDKQQQEMSQLRLGMELT